MPTNPYGKAYQAANVPVATTQIQLNEEFTPMKQMPLQKEPKEFPLTTPRSKEAEPIFIRIDKFEESLKIFEETKKQIKELGHMLHETKELKAKEDQELSSWETELQELKSRIGKVDDDLFSKIK